tara:strand:+ start:822 stop:1481 length:660 start_codon:yes stop_codon:yes gene_type:complete
MEHLTTKYIQKSFYETKVLPLLSFLYTDTMYSNKYDYYRIKDILDQYSSGQLESKRWAIDELNNCAPISQEDLVVVIGGWYGLMSHMLCESGVTNTIIDYEIDETCIDLHYKLKVHDNIMIEYQDGFEIFDSREHNGNDKVIICTACEHIDGDDLYGYVAMKNPKSTILLQSNNMHNIDSHVNCHDSLDDFIDSLPLDKILYKGAKRIGDYERYMVIAR